MASKAYLLVHNDAAGRTADVRDYLDSRAEVTDWMRVLSNTFVIVSELPADKLADLVQKFTEGRGMFLITRLSPDRSGWLPPGAWDFMENPGASKPRTPKKK
jgi:hypothetical protein